MTNYAKVKAAQTRAKKLIDKQNKLGWEVKQSVIDRANMEVPKNINARKAQAIIDNLSAETIRVTRTMKQRVVKEETTPIVSGNYKSGAKIYDVIHMDAPTVKRQDVEFTDRNVVRKVMGQIEFVLNNAPNRDVAQQIEQRLWGIELHGSQIFDTNDTNARRSAVIQHIISEKAIRESVKKAEASGYPATQALTTLYGDLVGEYGTDERGLAARQMRQFQSILESVGKEYSTDPGERQTAADVLRWLIENDGIWQSYRKQFKLKKVFKEVYDSNSLLTDVSDVLVDHPAYKMQVLNKLIELMSAGTAPWDILDKLEEFVEELADDQNS